VSVEVCIRNGGMKKNIYSLKERAAPNHAPLIALQKSVLALIDPQENVRNSAFDLPVTERRSLVFSVP
jgi:hypothetical protein